MNIVITGATGFIGQYVVRQALEVNHQITIITRNKQKAKKIFPPTITLIEHDLTISPLPHSLTHITGVINLMGENLAAKRWSNRQKEKIRQSRLQGSKNLLASLDTQLQVYIAASALGIYQLDAPPPWIETSPYANTFVGKLCQQWEAIGNNLPCRTAYIRIGAALGREGGIIAPLLPLFKLGLGGTIGSGQQYLSWMHVKDIAKLFITALEQQHYQGAINAVIDPPVTNQDFTNTLAKVLRRPAIMPVPKWILQIALGIELAELATSSQCASGEKLKTLGFIPQFSTLLEALNTL